MDAVVGLGARDCFMNRNLSFLFIDQSEGDEGLADADALFMIPSLIWCLATQLCYSQVACQEREVCFS